MRTRLLTRRRSPWLFIGLAVLAAASLAALAGGCRGEDDMAERYHCPMHPTYVSDRQGDCPICGMRLVPIQPESGQTDTTGASGRHESTPATALPADGIRTTAPYICTMCPEVQADQPGRCPKCGMRLVPNPASAEASSGGGQTFPARERPVLYYRSPMDPKVTSPVPSKDAMGMDFVPVYADQVAAEASQAGARSPGSVPGLAPITVSEEGMRLAGVRTAVAARERFAHTVRAVGSVKADETRVHRVQTKIAGWVEELFVNFTGQAVRRDAPMLSVYSPELLATQEELLHAREAAARFSASSLPEVRRGGEGLLAAARLRLELLDVPTSFIAELERTGRPQRAVTLVSPVSGYVIAKEVYEGQRVEPGMELLTVADLSVVWVEAAFYEFEASWLTIGQPAVVTLPYDSAVRREGQISYIYPALDEQSRTLRVRFDFANPDLVFKPGMFADVELQIDGGEGVVVPESAVMDTGERQVVFVEGAPGRITPRVVRVAARGGGKALLANGVDEGERVVVQANFLLDSESRLRAALAGSGARDAAGTGGHQHGGGAQ